MSILFLEGSCALLNLRHELSHLLVMFLNICELRKEARDQFIDGSDILFLLRPDQSELFSLLFGCYDLPIVFRQDFTLDVFELLYVLLNSATERRNVVLDEKLSSIDVLNNRLEDSLQFTVVKLD